MPKPHRATRQKSGTPPQAKENVQRKTFVDPDYLAGLDPDARLRKLIVKAGGDPSAIDGSTTARSIAESVNWSFDKAQELRPYRGGGSAKAGKVYDPKLSIRTLCDAVGSTEFEVILGYLRSDDGAATDLLADLFYSTNCTMNLHNVRFDESADAGKGRLYYSLRSDAATQENTDSISTKRLKDILREIRDEQQDGT